MDKETLKRVIARLKTVDPDRPGVATHAETYQGGYSEGVTDCVIAVERMLRETDG